MAVSGTVSQDIPTLRHMYDKAFRRAGIPAQFITAENLEIAKEVLNEILSMLAADGCTLWTNDHVLLGMKEGVPKVILPMGTIKVERANVRMMTKYTGTVSGSSPSWVLTTDEVLEAQYMGFKVSTAGIYNLAMDQSTDGVAWTQIATYEYENAVTGKWNWLEFTPDTDEVAYFRLRETTPTAFPVTDMCMAIEAGERELYPMAPDDYSAMTNKRVPGTVSQFWQERQVDGPELNLWSAPNEAHEDFILVCWRTRHVKDLGAMTDRAEIPQRWSGPLGWILAWRLAAEIPEAKKTPADIKPFADEAKAQIARTETDTSSTYITPDIGAYNA